MTVKRFVEKLRRRLLNEKNVFNSLCQIAKEGKMKWGRTPFYWGPKPGTTG